MAREIRMVAVEPGGRFFDADRLQDTLGMRCDLLVLVITQWLRYTVRSKLVACIDSYWITDRITLLRQTDIYCARLLH